MLHCLNTSGNLAGGCSDMTVLERQRARMKWQQEHGHFSGTGFNSVFSCYSQESMMMGADSGSALTEVVAQAGSIKPGPGFDVSSAISRTFSCPPAMVEAKVTEESFKKMKREKPQFVAENDNKDKRIKVGADDGDSKITGQPSTKNNTTTTISNNRDICAADTSNSKEISKASVVQKPDYIHVRARRGQATDSHSLAERVRREKISERMKYLQDLVPGCNKITGKAGMLDEIINYVQSLQRQVEFLSMKLAAVNPRLDFNIDDLFDKEFNSLQQIVSYGGLDTGINPSDTGLRRTISAPVSMPETFLDSYCFTQILPSSTWEGDFQNLYNLDFDQARATSFPSQLFTGGS